MDTIQAHLRQLVFNIHRGKHRAMDMRAFLLFTPRRRPTPRQLLDKAAGLVQLFSGRDLRLRRD